MFFRNIMAVLTNLLLSIAIATFHMMYENLIFRQL